MSLSGIAKPSFAAVRDTYAEILDSGLEQGSALAVCREDEVLVSLWGGLADHQGERHWQETTRVNIWSVTKALTALSLAMLVDRGKLDYGRPVAALWPEFAQGGKAGITLDTLLSHQGGLNGPEQEASVADLLAGQPYVEKLAVSTPLWEPGSQCVYHPLSWGSLAGEVLRRVDGRGAGRFLAEEIAGPLQLPITLGLPESLYDQAAELSVAPGTQDRAKTMQVQPLTRPGYANPSFTLSLANSRAWRAAEVPGANAHATALGLARLFAGLASGGRIGQERIIGQAALAEATRPRFEGIEAGGESPFRVGAGFMLNVEGLFGPNEDAFGHTGWGGSLAFADPATGLGVAYVVNRMIDLSPAPDPRRLALLEAIYSAEG